MRVLKNDVELIAVNLQQYSSNNDILTFEFEKPLDFKMEGSLVQIIYETDKLDNIKNNNITIEEIENKIVINWRIKESITLTTGDKRTQIVIKNNDSVYLSKVFIIKVLESLNVDNKIVETNLSYLEYWEERIKELAERIEQFEGTDLSQYITETLLNERLENYFNKLEIQEKLDKKANVNDIYTKNDTYNKTEVDNLIGNIDISEQLDNLATKTELDKKLSIETYNVDKQTFSTKQELNSKLDISTYNADKINFAAKAELDTKANKEVVENLSNVTITKEEFNNQKDTFQLKSDNTLQTTNKTIVGAINELKVNNIGGSKNCIFPKDEDFTPVTHYTGRLYDNELTNGKLIQEILPSDKYIGLFAVKTGSSVRLTDVAIDGSNIKFNDSDGDSWLVKDVSRDGYDVYDIKWMKDTQTNVNIFISFYLEVTPPNQPKEMLVISLYNFMEFKA